MDECIDTNVLLERIAELAKERNVSVTTVFVESGAGKNFKSNLRYSNPSQGKIALIANYLNVTSDYLTGKTNERNEKTPDIKSNVSVIAGHQNIYMIPVFDSVSAGFGTYADDYITEYMPMYFSNPTEANESIFVTVRGDSMYPKIEDGDVVLVHKQDSVDSGAIAVVLLDGEEALVKKVIYGDTWIELHSVNPEYQTRRFEGKDVLRLQVLGLVKKIIKNV